MEISYVRLRSPASNAVPLLLPFPFFSLKKISVSGAGCNVPNLRCKSRVAVAGLLRLLTMAAADHLF